MAPESDNSLSIALFARRVLRDMGTGGLGLPMSQLCEVARDYGIPPAVVTYVLGWMNLTVAAGAQPGNDRVVKASGWGEQGPLQTDWIGIAAAAVHRAGVREAQRREAGLPNPICDRRHESGCVCEPQAVPEGGAA